MDIVSFKISDLRVCDHEPLYNVNQTYNIEDEKRKKAIEQHKKSVEAMKKVLIMRAETSKVDKQIERVIKENPEWSKEWEEKVKKFNEAVIKLYDEEDTGVKGRTYNELYKLHFGVERPKGKEDNTSSVINYFMRKMLFDKRREKTRKN